MHKIDILMASYNSEKYIRNQLDSILNQTFNDFLITIYDDVSTDNTIDILSQYKLQHNNKISYKKNQKNVGVIKNFSNLLGNSSADYIMFSDHDDVWVNNKIELTYNKMLQMEKKYSKDMPLLVFCDKFVTDDNLNIIHYSHNKIEKYNTNNITFNRLLMANVISGCSLMINKALKNICGEINKKACMHDYYLVLCAAAFGKIGYINKPLLYYRQHTNNQLGAENNSLSNAFLKLKKGRKSMQESVFKNIIQAEAFYKQYENILSSNQKKILENFISLKKERNIKFMYNVIKNKFYKPGAMKNIGLFYAFL